MEKGLYMKAFFPVITILLGIICILYLLFYPRELAPFHGFSARVLAKENTHNTLSNALVLKEGAHCQREVSAYDSFYCCISSTEKLDFLVTSNHIQNLRITLLSDTGAEIKYQSRLSGNTRTLAVSDNGSGRLFLHIANRSTAICSFQLQIRAQAKTTAAPKTTPPTKTAPPAKTTSPANPKKYTISNPQTTSKPVATLRPKTKLSTINCEKPVLYPQFLSIKSDFMHNLSVKAGKKRLSLSDFVCLSSDPSVAVIKNGKLHTLREGIAILYIQNKKRPTWTSSCFVRVTG